MELLEFVLFIHRGAERVDIYIYCSSEKGFFLHVVMLGMWRLYGTSLWAELEALRRMCGASALRAVCNTSTIPKGAQPVFRTPVFESVPDLSINTN